MCVDLLGQTTILAVPIRRRERQTLTFNFATLPICSAGTQYAMVLSAPNAAADAIAVGIERPELLRRLTADCRRRRLLLC